MTGDWSFRRHCHAALRFGALAVLVLFVLWGIVDLFGSVPVITTLGHDADVIRLPFAYNSWLDVPSAFLFVVVFWALHYALLAATRPGIDEQASIKDGLICGMVLGLVCGVMAAVIASFSPTGIVIVPILLGAINLVLPLNDVPGNLSLLLTTSFAAGAVSCLVAGVGPGLIIALIIAAISIAIVATIKGLMWLIIDVLTDIGFWRKVWDLLTAADINGK